MRPGHYFWLGESLLFSPIERKQLGSGGYSQASTNRH